MRNLSLLALGFFLFMNPLLGAVFTETHCYIVSHAENKLLIVDRQTGEEKILELGSAPYPVVIYKDKGFIAHHDSWFLSVLDLKNNEICSHIDFDSSTLYFCIHGDYGYIYEWRWGRWCVVDLTRCKIIKRFDLEGDLDRHFFYGNAGYFWSTESDSIKVLDLNTHTVFKSFKSQGKIRTIFIKGNKGFVVGFNESTINVIDLEKQILAAPIKLNTVVDLIAFFKDKIYAFGSGHSSLYAIDQGSHKVIGDYYCRHYMHELIPTEGWSYLLCSSDLFMVDLFEGKMPYGAPCTFDRVKKLDSQTYFLKEHTLNGIYRSEVKLPHQCCKKLKPQKQVIIHDGRAYMPTYKDKIIVVDIKSNKVMRELKSSEALTLDCSDTHVYAGVTKLCAVDDWENLSLLDSPYPGITGDWDGDGELALNRFALAFFSKNEVLARSFFKEALACGHGKAYAIAAYSFLHGKYGAKDDDNHWWLQFLTFSDKDTFQKMSSLGLGGICFLSLRSDQKKALVNRPQVIYSQY